MCKERLIGKTNFPVPKFVKVINLDFSKKILTLLAIFCVIASAGVVCAADVGSDVGYVGVDSEDMGGFAGSHYHDDIDDGGLAEDFNYTDDGLTDRPIIDPDYAHMEHAAGAPGNSTGNATGNATANATSQMTANASGAPSTSHTMPATGNPILALFAVAAVIGGSTLLRRK